jgi:hypothetical protein
MNTVPIRDFHGELVRKTMLPNFVKDFLLLNDKASMNLLAEQNNGEIPSIVSCERFVLNNVDNSLLPSFLGYFFIRDQ